MACGLVVYQGNVEGCLATVRITAPCRAASRVGARFAVAAGHTAARSRMSISETAGWLVLLR